MFPRNTLISVGARIRQMVKVKTETHIIGNRLEIEEYVRTLTPIVKSKIRNLPSTLTDSDIHEGFAILHVEYGSCSKCQALKDLTQELNQTKYEDLIYEFREINPAYCSMKVNLKNTS